MRVVRVSETISGGTISLAILQISHVLYFPNQGEYLTETPLGPGGEASYSTVSILPTSLPVSKKITRMEFLENKSMWSISLSSP